MKWKSPIQKSLLSNAPSIQESTSGNEFFSTAIQEQAIETIISLGYILSHYKI
jgi:hypothetical protein